MPAIKYYTVTQERRVKVSSDNIQDAISIARQAFEGKRDEENLNSRLRSQVEEIEIVAREDY